jgi:anti-anti-sigma regulatory factor
VGGGLALAIIASIDALLCTKLVCPQGEPRTDADRLLVRLGLGNIVTACFGGITSGINIGPTLTNRAFGGRTPLSVLVNAIVILLAFTVLFPLLTMLPRAVLSAVIMVVAVQHLDPWSIKLIERMAVNSGIQRRRLVLDLLVVVLVAALAISLNIVLAVFIGVAIAVVLFVLRMSRSIVRRSYRCNAVHSRRSRDAAEIKALERHGGAILVMELEGALFFGTGERLLDEISAATERDTRALILDLRRVNEIDSTGARTLVELEAGLERNGIRLGLVLAKDSGSMLRLKDMAVLERIPEDHIFEDLDRAIEWAENELLCDLSVRPISTGEIRLERVGILRDLDPAEVAAVTSRLTRVAQSKGGVIFHQGDKSTDLFVVTRGTASAYIRRPEGRDIRLVTFGPGTVFGELAILDARPRSASIVADDEFVCYALSKAQFAALSREAPLVAIKLLVSLARELTDRLRRANRMIDELEM